MRVPVFLLPFYGRPDLVQRMLDSLDVPIERGLLVDNALVRPDLVLPPNVIVHTPPYESMGWGGTLNFGIMQTFDAPWWMWCSNDMVMRPGEMDEICFHMEKAGSNPLVVHNRWAVGALNRAVVQAVGLFDEWSYWPIYFEDTDYAWRCHNAGVKLIYGEWGHEGADGFQHSVTVQTNPGLSVANNHTWQLNERAYADKWGGLPGKEEYATPWDNALPLWVSKPDLDGRVARRWPRP